MKLAKDMGWKKVIFELDSEVAVDLIRNGCANSHPCRPIIMSIELPRNSDWNVKFVHCYQGSNSVADCLAKLAHSMEVKWEGMISFNQPPKSCLNVTSEDLRGLSLP